MTLPSAFQFSGSLGREGGAAHPWPEPMGCSFRIGEEVRSDFNIFNLRAQLAARKPAVWFSENRERKSHKPCNFSYKPPAKSCHRDSSGRKRGFYTRKGQLSPSFAFPSRKYTTFFARKQELLIHRKAIVKKADRPQRNSSAGWNRVPVRRPFLGFAMQQRAVSAHFLQRGLSRKMNRKK